MEVLQKPIDFQDRPTELDRSGGRFLALSDEYLDAALYAEGREVTVAGVVEGKRVQRLDEIDYSYPLIRVKKIHLWHKRTDEPYGYSPRFHHWYSPWWYPYHGWYRYGW